MAGARDSRLGCAIMSKENWSVGVLEYWKKSLFPFPPISGSNELDIQINNNSGFSALLHHSMTPILRMAVFKTIHFKGYP